MTSLLTRHILLFSIVLSVLTYSMAYWYRWNLEHAVLGSTAFTLLTAILLEKVIPFNHHWNKNHGDLNTDLTSAAVLIGFVDPLLKLLSPLFVVSIYSALNQSSGPDLLGSLPLLMQVSIATLLIELGRYWSHRLHHVAKPLWRLHAMHHSSQRLYAINNFRFHPLNYMLNFLIGVLPVMVLGVSTEALLGYLAISQPVLMLQHANLNLKSGWLNYVFSTNEVHRWHHSNVAQEANSNYGNAIVLWDQLFGTFRFENDSKNQPTALGLFSSGSGYPSHGGYFKQLCSSIRPACCSA